MTVNSNSLLNYAIDYATRNPQKVYKAATLAYKAGSSVYKALSRKPTPTSAPRTVTYNRFIGSRVLSSNRKRIYRKVRKVRKTKKINRLVGKSAPRKSIYSRRTKTMRQYNSGKLSLQQRLQNGGALPNTTFARMFWRGSCGTEFTTKNPLATVGDSGPVNSRTLCLNDISSSPVYSNVTQMKHGVTYAPLWKTLYERYLVLGATCKIKINTQYYPSLLSNMATGSTDPETHNHKYSVPANAQPGYWYVRAYYKRSAVAGGDPTPVGHPIVQGSSSDDPKTEDLWPNLREFLSDPTVTFKKDTTNIRTKLHIHSAANLYNATDGNPTGYAPVAPSTGTSYEIETATKPVYLSCNFSAKKHFQDKNPLRNQPFNEWDTNLSTDYRFQIRFGYIGFSSDGDVAYHIPIDRNFRRMVEFEIQYFVALRDPRINPHDPIIPVDPEALRKLDEDVVMFNELEPEPDGEDDNDNDTQYTLEF